MPVIEITSDSIVPIENHFRVSAGPGAGKTHWLVNHIRNVLQHSNRLGKTRKVACITYTNIAVETILNRLGLSVDRVEVSTIHSFLYKHIVKPYVSIIASEFNLNVLEMDGHDDIVLSSYPFLKELKEKTGQGWISEDGKLVKAIAAAQWKFDKQNNLIINTEYPHKIGKYPPKNTTFLEYKKMAWAKGVVHHDDVLFFSYQLLLRLPFIIKVLNAKFPYFFVDEFQDTNPIQTQILRQIGHSETIVGIVGDKVQSIYGFQGAEPVHFNTFDLANLIDYRMVDNRRSTNQIIDFLNAIRKDIQQNKYRMKDCTKPTIIIGRMGSALQKAKDMSSGCDVCSLSRDNITSNAMKKELCCSIPTEDMFNLFNEIDSNSERKRIIMGCIKATELSRQKRFKEAIKELIKVFKDKKEALKIICTLLQMYDTNKDRLLIDYLTFVNDKIKVVSRLKAGNIQSFYSTHYYQQLAVCVKITEDTSLHRTIHKAKSAEFDNVLLILKDEKGLDFILEPNFDNNEEHRINYVAVSRAKERLFITLPSMNGAIRDRIKNSFDVIDV